MKKLFLLLALLLNFCPAQGMKNKTVDELIGAVMRTEDCAKLLVLYDNPLNRKKWDWIAGVKFDTIYGEPSIWMYNLEVDENYRNSGIGAIALQSFIQFLIKEYPQVNYLKWKIQPYDRPKNSNYYNMLERLTKFYIRQGASVNKKEGAKSYKATINLKKHPVEQFNSNIPVKIVHPKNGDLIIYPRKSKL